MSSGTVSTQWLEIRPNARTLKTGEVIEEAPVTIYVNGITLATIMSSPLDQDLLALGFLKNEGLIESLAEIAILHISKMGCCVDIWLHRPFVKPSRTIITSGCGGGVTFTDPDEGIPPLDGTITLKPETIHQGFRQLQSSNSLYARSRGVHTAGLLDPQTGELNAIVEDVGRHNTIDKIAGFCLKNNIQTQQKALLVTGRISSEMMRKAALMGCPIVASLTSPTSLSIEMARAWNITLVGYARKKTMLIYTSPQRAGYK